MIRRRSPRAPLSGRRLAAGAALLLAAAVATGFACLVAGPSSPGARGWRFWEWALWTSPVWRIRAFRIGAAATVGAALATAGLATQGLLRNPLAEPYLLGISSGAGVGVLAGLAVSGSLPVPHWCTTSVAALLGALAAAAVVYALAQRRGKIDPLVLILSGVIVNVFNGALVLVLLQFVGRDQVLSFVGWAMGQIPEWLWFQPGLLAASAAVTAAGWAFVFLRGSALNVLALGEEVAASSGVAVSRLRFETFIVVSLMTSAAVALAGPVGFVGLVVPHACRMMFGPDHRILAVVSGLGGAIFLMAADAVSRQSHWWTASGELPVGAVTALTGGPFFIYLLRRRLRGEEA